MTDLEDAAVARDADVAALATLTPDQIDYLARLNEVPDPLTDGLACEEG